MINELLELGRSDWYPFHMPGHKRNMPGFVLENAYRMDITEIDGFDDLRDPSGLILRIEEEAASHYGVDRAFLLVNGSTCGNLASICSFVPYGSRLLMNENCHISAKNAVFLRGGNHTILKPGMIPGPEIPGGISKDAVKDALQADPDIKAVFITSPTYEGVLSDLDGIAQTAHEAGIPLIADAAHGAHLPVSKKADVSIVSLHKTLPAFTSTSLCLVNGDRKLQDRIREYINIFQTTSPSYLLMSGAEECFRILKEEGGERRQKLKENLSRLYEALSDNHSLKAVDSKLAEAAGEYGFDDTKICLYDRKGLHTGQQIYDILRQDYRIQPEKAGGKSCLCLSSLMDTKEGFDRLISAVCAIDKKWEKEDGY